MSRVAFFYGRWIWAGCLATLLYAGMAVLRPGVCPAFELLRVNGDPCDNASRNLAWPSASAPVDVRFVRPIEWETLAATASARWNESARRFRFGRATGAACDLDDGVVTVRVGTTSCTGERLGDVLAVTTSRWLSDGRLLDAEIVVNEDSVALADEAVFLEVVLHELGHVLGLDHSDACGESGAGTLMKSVLVLSEPRLDRPQADDAAGADFIYPAAPSGELPEGANSCTILQPGENPAWAPFLVGAGLLVGAWLLGRRRGRCFGPAARRDHFAVDEHRPVF